MVTGATGSGKTTSAIRSALVCTPGGPFFDVYVPTISAVTSLQQNLEFTDGCGFRYSTIPERVADFPVTVKTNAYGIGRQPNRRLILDELQKRDFVQMALLERALKAGEPVVACGANIPDFVKHFIVRKSQVKDIEFQGVKHERKDVEPKLTVDLPCQL